MLVGMDAMIKLPHARDWTFEQTPFVYLPKDIVLRRLLNEWTTLDASQIMEATKKTVSKVEGGLDLDSDSDGGADTANFSDDDEIPVNERKQQNFRRPLKNDAQHRQRRLPKSRGLAERFKKLRMPEDTGFVQTNHSGIVPDVDPLHRRSRPGRPPPSRDFLWVGPGLTSSEQLYGPESSYPNPAQRTNLRPPHPPPPPPPSPPRFTPHRKREDVAEPVGSDTGNYQPRTPSLNDSQTAVVNESSGAPHEDGNKGRYETSNDPLEGFRKRVAERERSHGNVDAHKDSYYQTYACIEASCREPRLGGPEHINKCLAHWTQDARRDAVSEVGHKHDRQRGALEDQIREYQRRELLREERDRVALQREEEEQHRVEVARLARIAEEQRAMEEHRIRQTEDERSRIERDLEEQERRARKREGILSQADTGGSHVGEQYQGLNETDSNSRCYGESEEATQAETRGAGQSYPPEQGPSSETKLDVQADYRGERFAEHGWNHGLPRKTSQQSLEETYQKTFQRTYADLMREDAEKRQYNDAIRAEVMARIQSEKEAAAKKAEEEREISEKLTRMVEAEREQVDPEKQEPQPGTYEFVRQFMDQSQGTVNEATEPHVVQDGINMSTDPHITESNIMSHVTEESPSTTSAGSTPGGTSSGDEDSDATETNSTSTDSQSEDGEPANSDVERSQPWKGPAYLGNFMELTPFYLRGSDAGQTWYHGEDPIYIVEYKEGYNGDTAHEEMLGSAHKGQYLLISKLWVDAEALDRFGFNYSSCPPSYFYLDPSLSWESIETLVNFTFYLREVETFRTFGQIKGPSLAGGRPPPPPLDFSSPDKACRVSSSSGSEQPSKISRQISSTEKSEIGKAEENGWGFRSNITYPLSVINFALHTIV